MDTPSLVTTNHKKFLQNQKQFFSGNFKFDFIFPSILGNILIMMVDTYEEDIFDICCRNYLQSFSFQRNM